MIVCSPVKLILILLGKVIPKIGNRAEIPFIINMYNLSVINTMERQTAVSLTAILIRDHALSFFNKAISRPVFIGLQTFSHSFPLSNSFLLPPHQIRMSREVLKRNAGRKKDDARRKSETQFLNLFQN